MAGGGGGGVGTKEKNTLARCRTGTVSYIPSVTIEGVPTSTKSPAQAKVFDVPTIGTTDYAQTETRLPTVQYSRGSSGPLAIRK